MKLLSHNINACTGKQKAQFAQVYDSAYAQGLNLTRGERVPTIPKNKEKNNGTPSQGADLLPKTVK
jgi:hypothetical protein